MRVLLTAIILLALPAALTAQEAADEIPAEVQLQQSVSTDLAEPAPSEVVPSIDPAIESADAAEEAAAVVQDPGSRSWWYIVGAVVVGGLILALLL